MRASKQILIKANKFFILNYLIDDEKLFAVIKSCISWTHQYGAFRTGRVHFWQSTDKDDKPLQNVQVKTRYQGNFTMTDANGNYRIYLKAKRISIVEFSIEGEETQVEEFYLRKRK